MGRLLRRSLDRDPYRKAAVSCSIWSLVAAVVAMAPGVTGAGPAAGEPRPLIVASTTIVADLVGHVAGEGWRVVSLMPPGADPHAFEPTPQDARVLSGARLVVLVGAGLEPPAVQRLARSAGSARVVELAPRVAERWDGSGDEGAEGAFAGPLGGPAEGGDSHEDGDGHGHGGRDPHVWTSVPKVMAVVRELARVLEGLDPQGASGYRARAQRYLEELRALDGWVREQVAALGPDRRRLVTNHETLNYFAREYGFEVVGVVIPSVSTLAEPTAAETARLLDRIRRLGVPAIFTETTVSPALATALARDAGVRVVTLYSDSLGLPGSGADTYVGYMRTNVRRIVEALADGS